MVFVKHCRFSHQIKKFTPLEVLGEVVREKRPTTLRLDSKINIGYAKILQLETDIYTDLTELLTEEYGDEEFNSCLLAKSGCKISSDFIPEYVPEGTEFKLVRFPHYDFWVRLHDGMYTFVDVLGSDIHRASNGKKFLRVHPSYKNIEMLKNNVPIPVFFGTLLDAYPIVRYNYWWCYDAEQKQKKKPKEFYGYHTAGENRIERLRFVKPLKLDRPYHAAWKMEPYALSAYEFAKQL
jgi:hypothetical protein